MKFTILKKMPITVEKNSLFEIDSDCRDFI